MGVWQDLDSLHHHVYRSAHSKVMVHRKQWFEQMREVYSVLWWLPAGHLPTLQEASERLETGRQKGRTPRAFTLKQAFAPG